MSGELGDRLRAAAGPADPPPVANLWGVGRRRRRRQALTRAAAGGLGVLAVLAVASMALDRGYGRQEVRSEARAQTSSASVEEATCYPEPHMEYPSPPDSVEGMLEGAYGRAGQPPPVVARMRVVRSWWLEPTTIGPGERSWDHRIEVEVTDPVRGAEVGDRFTVFDADGMAGPDGAGSDEPVYVSGPACHLFQVGDDLILGLSEPRREDVRELATEFFVITEGRFSPELDAARRSLGPGWEDNALLALVRETTPEAFLELLREADESGT